MEVKRVIKLFFVLMVVAFSGNAQEKYLLYNPEKDSVICRGDTKYYKIDNNLFDIDRYNQTDTVNHEQFKFIKLSIVEELYQEGEKSFIRISEEKNLFIETYNEIFEHIYVLEKLSKSNYKRTRVWWIDY